MGLSVQKIVVQVTTKIEHETFTSSHVEVPTKSKARKIMRALWYEHYLESTSDVALTAATDMKET